MNTQSLETTTLQTQGEMGCDLYSRIGSTPR